MLMRYRRQGSLEGLAVLWIGLASFSSFSGRICNPRFGQCNNNNHGLLLMVEAANPLKLTESGAVMKKTVGGGKKEERKPRSGVFKYNICNGLSNQLLYHAASISQAIRQNYARVEIPDYFILQGTQMSDANVLPNSNNSIPFGYAFDQEHFLRTLSLQFGIQGSLVRFSESNTGAGGGGTKRPECKGMAALQLADSETMRVIIDAFRPSKQHMQPLVNAILMKLDKSTAGDPQQGVCLHHRDGQDWHDHCRRWGSIPDGVYRGNCLTVPGQSLLQAMRARGMDTPGRWVYYCGDHGIPPELDNQRDLPLFTVTSRQHIMDFSDDDHAIRDTFLQQQQLLSHDYGLGIDLSSARDFWALIDFYVCKVLPYFIGNSVSTFSAIQIALRNGQGAYWYNSQSVPLQEMWRVFQVPVVYTYTELSAATGKHLLQTSIESVRLHMPNNKIHMLYNGQNDTKFISWLKSRNVILHDHNPTWKDKIEEMRLNGDSNTSHLFLHSGNYFGTWQRIDIPMFLETEYVLLLDADTIVRKPFTLADLGLNLTYGIAMSSEIDFEDKTPSNAGVTLMNIPHLRSTHKQFMRFVMRHVKKGKFDHPSPSDQGAYLVFYNDSVKFLSQYFNFKPYWEVKNRVFQRAYVIHYHGPKPHDYIRFIMGKGCDKAVKFLCAQGIKISPELVCHSLSIFATASMSVDRTAYCQASFRVPSQAAFCQKLFEHMSESPHECRQFYKLIGKALDSVPPYMKLPRTIILRRLGLPEGHGKLYWFFMYGSVIGGWILLAVYSVRMRSRSIRQLTKLLLAAIVGWIGLSIVLTFTHLEIS